VVERKEPAKQMVKRRIKKLGLIRTVGQIFFILYGKLASRQARAVVADHIRKAGLDPTPLSKREFVRVESVNDEKVRELIRELKPDVIVVNGTRIIRKHILDSTSVHFINTHFGITPMYRGVHGAYWALAQSDPGNCGITVHIVDPGVDTGPVLYQTRIQPERTDTFFTYPTLQAIAAAPLLVRAVRDCLKGNAAPYAPGGKSRQWYHPTLWGYIRTGFVRGIW